MKLMAQAEDGATFDFVIVGAGSAGCVLANRLSEDPKNTVALMEAGGKDSSILIRMPSGSSELFKQKGSFNWGFETEPQAHADGRRLFWPRGRGWGGSSSINGLLYVRGHARDYDQWRQMGLTGWGYRDVLPYFKRAETYAGGGDAYHGADGPLRVQEAAMHTPLFRAFIEAGKQAGYKETKDFNGRQQEGVGPYQVTIHNRERQSASAAYLRPIVDIRSNLEVISNAHAHRILIENGRAVGVVYSAGPPRSDPRRRRCAEPASAYALRHRRGQPAARLWDRCRRGADRGRPQSAGSLRRDRRARMHAAGHDLFEDEGLA
jgi:choline dehydrogenase